MITWWTGFIFKQTLQHAAKESKIKLIHFIFDSLRLFIKLEYYLHNLTASFINFYIKYFNDTKNI